MAHMRFLMVMIWAALKKIAMKYIMDFSEIGISDVSIAGGKNASLGELYNNLSVLGIQVPGGFAVTADASRFFIQENQLAYSLKQLLTKLDGTTYKTWRKSERPAEGYCWLPILPKPLRKRYCWLTGPCERLL